MDISGFNLFDLAVVLLALAAASGGYRLGFVARGASWIGLLLGLAVASWAVPLTLGFFSSGTALTRMAVGLVVLVIVVGVVTSTAERVGFRLRRRVHGTRLRPVDQGAGAIAGVLFIATLVWFLAPAAAEVPGTVSRQVRESQVSRLIAGATPEPPDAVHALRGLVDTSRFPQVFADLRPAPDTGPPPSEIPVPQEVVDRVTASTVNIETEACGRRYEGSGWTVEPGLVVTNAHVVAGAERVQARRPDGTVVPGRVVAFDDGRDLALVQVPDLGQEPLPIGPAAVGTDGAVTGYPGGQDTPRTTPASVRDKRPTVGRDIYGRDIISRDLLFLAASLRQGDSGSPVYDASGTVVGTVFAVSPDRPSTAYALDIEEVRAVLAGPRDQGPGPCQ